MGVGRRVRRGDRAARRCGVLVVVGVARRREHIVAPRAERDPAERRHERGRRVVTAPGQRASLSTLLEEGQRAVTVRVDDVRGVAGFILPGDRVDVMLHGDGQYAPEFLSSIYHPLVTGEADAVFGSRMMNDYGGPLKGGMPV